MAYTVESRTNNPATQLRDALDKAERMVVQLDRQNVEEFLVLLDTIEQMFDELKQGEADLRPEEARWQSLLNRIDSRPGDVAKAAAGAGGLDQLRGQHPPAESFWWHLDAEVARRRRQTVRRVALTLGGLLLAGALLLWGINYFFPPNPIAVAMVETTHQIDQYVAEQRWADALQVVHAARQNLPDEPELAVWEVVLNERLGDTAAAAAVQETALALFGNQPENYWLQLGNTRMMVGDLDGAEAAAQQAETLAPDEAMVYFLQAGIAEARGDTARAVELFDKTFQLAGDTNPQLSVIARVRMGQLMQQPNLQMSPVATPTPTPEP
jgi:tetratricopeptide (TPR) repeat protein